MATLVHFFWFVVAVFMALGIANGVNTVKAPTSYRTIFVDPSPRRNGYFSTIQSAIDSIPSKNMYWTCISIKAGLYKEQVKIPYDKPFIYLKGDGRKDVNIIWDGHAEIDMSATFMSRAGNIVVEGITFTNSYNYPPETSRNRPKQAPAAMIEGDKSAFYRCRFLGHQDTLWDVGGRHYFKDCTIEGAVDFIFGAGQSIYEACTISTNAAALGNNVGFITAQGRSSLNEPSGFVFKDCNVFGTGKVYLGRAWRGFARVVFYNTSLSNVIMPQGWGAWEAKGRENQLTYVEYGCHGTGADTSKRVKWTKNMNQENLWWMTRMSFIDNEGWISSQPFNTLA